MHLSPSIPFLSLIMGIRHVLPSITQAHLPSQLCSAPPAPLAGGQEASKTRSSAQGHVSWRGSEKEMGWKTKAFPTKPPNFLLFPIYYGYENSSKPNNEGKYNYEYQHFFFLVFLEQHLQHMEVLRLGAVAAGLHHSHSNAGSLTH